MISRIRGSVIARHPDRVEVMTAGGVGYELFIPLRVFERMPDEGAEAEFLTVQVVREDAVQLFGFLERLERDLFLKLIAATRVGPRLALSLLSSLSPERLVGVVRSRDVKALTSVNGVGRKTAERLVVELAERFDDLQIHSEGPGRPGREEAITALTVLGFSREAASDAVREVMKEDGDMATQEVVRRAMAHLG